MTEAEGGGSGCDKDWTRTMCYVVPVSLLVSGAIGEVSNSTFPPLQGESPSVDTLRRLIQEELEKQLESE